MHTLHTPSETPSNIDEKYKKIFDNAAIGIYTVSSEGKVVSINGKACEILGYTESEIVSKHIYSFIQPEDIYLSDEALDKLIHRDYNSSSYERRCITKNGDVIWTNVTASILTNSENQSEEFIISMQDITDIKQADIEIRNSNARYEALNAEYSIKESLLRCLIDSIPDFITIKDKNGVFLGCNKAFEQLIGRKESDLVGKNAYEFLDKLNFCNSRHLDRKAMSICKPVRQEEVLTYFDGKTVLVETLKLPYYDGCGNLIGVVTIGLDIEERKKKEDEIQFLYYHDVLTNLYNKAFFDRAVRKLDTSEQYPLSIIFGDVNGLKLVNDAFGHVEGDKLLVEMANILLKCTRKDDIVARVGGDEFCLLLPKTNRNDVQEILKRIKAECSKHVMMSTCNFSISLGSDTKTDDSRPFSAVIKNAEDRMYRHKLLEQKSVHSSILSSIKAALYERSNETEAHAERLARLAKKLSNKLGITQEKIDQLELLCALHDVGKMGINDAILKKTDVLTEEEWGEMKKHSEIGARIASAISEIRSVSDYILYHHERWDGKGYPDGLEGEEIPLLSRIIAIVDAYDAMTHDRVYRSGFIKEKAINELKANAGTQFDPNILKVFIEEVLK